MRFVQWMMGVAVIAVGGAGTLWLLSPGETARLRRENEELARRQIELQRAIDRLTGEDRIAEVRVIDQIRAGNVVDGEVAPGDITVIDFIELDREQHPLPSRRFKLCGREIHFDALVLKFDHEYVAAGDALRGKSLALFRRIYCENQTPADGFPVDAAGDVPNVYRVNPEPSKYELELWEKFWEYAANPKLAAAKGVREAQGVAVYKPMKKGQVWTLTLEHSGGPNLTLHRPGEEEAKEPGLQPAQEG